MKKCAKCGQPIAYPPVYDTMSEALEDGWIWTWRVKDKKRLPTMLTRMYVTTGPHGQPVYSQPVIIESPIDPATGGREYSSTAVFAFRKEDVEWE